MQKLLFTLTALFFYSFGQAQNVSDSIPSKELFKSLTPGIYYYEAKSKDFIRLTGFHSSYSSKNDIITGMSAKGYYTINGEKSLTKISETRPSFYIVSGTGANNVSFEPTRFVVAIAELKKGNRQVLAYKGASGNNEGKNATLNKKVTIPTELSRVTNDIYKVSFSSDLVVGNYFFGPSQIRAYTDQDFFEFDITK